MCPRNLTFLLFLVLIFYSCDLFNPAEDGNNGGDTDSTAVFMNVSSRNLPEGLAGNTQEAKSADVDGDGDFDLVLAIRFRPNWVLFNDGNGNFSTLPPLQLATRNFDTQDVSVTDFNGDGAPDIIFVSGQSRAHELFINNGAGSYSDISNRIPVSGESTCVTTFDINGDGPVDIAIGNLVQNFILINNGNAFFTNQTTQRLPQRQDRTRDIEFSDVTGDGLRDMVIANDELNRLLINTGAGFFSDQSESRLPFIGTVYSTRDIELVDVDGDGDTDIYFANAGFQTGVKPPDRLLINDGQGVFTDQSEERLPSLKIHSIDADFFDLDNDRDLDVVIGNYNGGVHILLNDGNGVFSDETESWMPEGFDLPVNDVEVGLFNEDRLPDLYIGIRNAPDQLLFQRN